MGKDDSHIRLLVSSKTAKKFKMVGFRFGYITEIHELGDTVDVVYEIGLNEWNGNREIQLRIVDIKHFRRLKMNYYE